MVMRMIPRRCHTQQGNRATSEKLRDFARAVVCAALPACWIASTSEPFRKVGEDDFLYEPETLQVFGDLTISQQYELAKASLDVKQSIRELEAHFLETFIWDVFFSALEIDLQKPMDRLGFKPGRLGHSLRGTAGGCA